MLEVKPALTVYWLCGLNPSLQVIAFEAVPKVKWWLMKMETDGFKHRCMVKHHLGDYSELRRFTFPYLAT
jgi:hypothetical protein